MRAHYRIILVFLCLEVSVLGLSQDIEWLRINPLPYESTVNCATLIPGTNKVISVGEYATLMFSDDNGENWTLQRRPGNISKDADLISVYFPSPLVGYILGSNSLLLKSTDSGTTWADITLEGNYNHQEISFIDEETGFITGANGYILRTADGAVTWDTVMTFPGIKAGSPNFINDSTGYIGNTSHTYYLMTHDRGLSWDSIPFHPIPDVTNLIACYFLKDSVGFITSSTDTNYNPTYRIFKTINGGMNWSEIFNSGLYCPFSYLFLDENTGFVMGSSVMYKDFILRTTDGGQNWALNDDFTWFLNSMVFTEGQTGLIFGTNARIYRSQDLGSSWDKESSSVFKSKIYSAEILNDNVVIAGGAESGGGVPSGRIIRSDDGGWSWHSVCFSLGPVTDICFPDNQTGYAVTDAGMFYKTTDGGKNWYFLDINPDCWNMTDIECIGDNIVLVTGCDFILKSESAGDFWSYLPVPQDNPIEFSSVNFLDEYYGYAVGEGPENNIIVTHDGGNSWEVMESPTPAPLTCALPLDQDKALLFGNSGVIFRLDTGYVVEINEENDKPSSEIPCKIYPNPFSDQFNIDFGESNSLSYSIEIYSITGEKLMVLRCKNHEGTIHLDVPDLAPGIYLVRIINCKQQFQIKILKTNSRT